MELRRSRLVWWLGAAALCAYLFFSLAYLDLPGLEYDETAFVNAALGDVIHIFVDWGLRVGRSVIPLMVMGYIGAVKAWLYAPIFAAFGTSVASVRLPVILLGLGTLTLTFVTVRAMLGERVALLSLILLATDPTFIFANRLDWGPVSISMLLKCASLCLIWRWLIGGRTFLLAYAAFLLGLGLYDKIVFAWFIGALVPAIPLFFWSRVKPRLSRGVIAIALVSFLAGCWPLIAFNIRHPLQTLRGQKIVTRSWPSALAHRYGLFRQTLSGSGVLFFINLQSPEDLIATYRRPPSGKIDSLLTALLRRIPLVKSFADIVFVLSLGLILIQLARSRLSDCSRVLFFAFLVLAQAAFVCFTAQAGGAHHAITVYPFVHVLIAYAVCEGIRLAGNVGETWARWCRGGAMASGLLLVLLPPVVVDAGYIKAFAARGGAGQWSDAIYSLGDYIRQNQDRKFFVMDWGFATQLLVLRGREINWDESYFKIRDGRTGSIDMEGLRPYLINPGNLFVFHASPFQTYDMLDVFQSALAQAGLESRVVALFRQRDGQVNCLIYETVHPTLEIHRRLGGYFWYREGEDFDSKSGGNVGSKPMASRSHTLGNSWGRAASDYASYKFVTEKAIEDMAVGIRYASEGAGPTHCAFLVDGENVGTLELGATETGLRPGELNTARLRIGRVMPGEHELRLQPVEPNRPIDVDYLYLAESDFEFLPPTYETRPEARSLLSSLSAQVRGVQNRPDIKLEANNHELTAGKGMLSLRTVNFSPPAIDVLYSLNGNIMPIIRGWGLDNRHTTNVFVDNGTPKGLYVFKAIRDSRDRSPEAWIPVNLHVTVK